MSSLRKKKKELEKKRIRGSEKAREILTENAQKLSDRWELRERDAASEAHL